MTIPRLGPPDDGGSAAPPPRASPLLADHAARWPRRVPPASIKVIVVVALVVAVAVSVRGEDDSLVTAAVVQSPSYVLFAASASALIAAIGVVLVAPTIGLAVAAIGSLAVSPLLEVNAGESDVWSAVFVLLTALALADAVTRARQRAVARVWCEAPSATFAVPQVPAPLRADLLRIPWGWFSAGAACLVLGLGAMALLVHDTRSAAAFRADSLVASTRVDALIDDGLTARVTINGTRYRVPLPSGSPEVGQQVEVRYQSRTHRAELTGDVFDPTLALIPGVGGLFGAAALFSTAARRRRGLVDLLDVGGLAFGVRATWSARDHGAVLTPYDDVTRHFATAPSLATWVGALWSYDDENLVDDDVNLVDDDEFAAEDTDDDERYARQPLGAESWDNTPVVVVGLARGGAPVALQDRDGRWYVTEIALRRGRWRFDLVMMGILDAVVGAFTG